MVRYELKKIFSRPLGKGALVVLVVLLGLTIFFACQVRYTDEAGEGSAGPAAARQLRQQQKLNTKAVQIWPWFTVKFHVLQLALLQQMW